MEAKNRGSFGLPPEMAKQIEEARRKPELPPEPVAVSTPEVPEAEKSEETKREEEYKRVRKDLVASLGFELTSEDLKTYIFKGRLQKDVVLIPDVASCTLKTTTPKDAAAIDEKLAAFRDLGKFTARGLENEEALLTLSYCLIALNGKPLAATEDPDKRLENIRNMGDHFVDMIFGKLRELSTLLRLTLQEKQILKKS